MENIFRRKYFFEDSDQNFYIDIMCKSPNNSPQLRGIWKGYIESKIRTSIVRRMYEELDVLIVPYPDPIEILNDDHFFFIQ